MSRGKTVVGLAAFALAALGALAYAQEVAPPADAGARGNRGNRPDFRAQMETRMKEALGVKDDTEWKAIQPKIEKVQTAQRQARGGGMMGMGGRGPGGRGPGAGADRPAADQPAPPPPSDVEKKGAELKKVLDNKDAKPDEVKAALTALRDARTKAREELEKAQKDLKDVLTQRQEAQMVLFGILD